MSREDEAIAIGIDLGTTYSCVAAWFQEHKKIEIIPNEQGNFTTPSCVAFNEEECLIGEGAKNQITINPENSIYDVKRLMGRKFSDVTVQEDMKSWPFKVIKSEENQPTVVVTYKGEKREFAPEQISAMVLMKMKEIAETYLGKSVKKAVITVPAYFNDSQRQATKNAGAIAGLDVLQLLNEPTAAAIAYGLSNVESRESRREKNVVVFDLGGGTFDISVLNLSKDGKFQVKAVGGDSHLGGGDFDNKLLHHLVQEFKRKHKKDMSGNAKAMGKLRTYCEKAKRDLSSALQTTISVDCLYKGIDFSTKVTRAQFEDLNKDFFNQCIECMKACLGEANMHKDNVDEVVIVGGSTRIPKVQTLLTHFFGGKELCKTINPEVAVAHGAAALAAKLTSQGTDMRQFTLADVTPLSLGTEIFGDVMSVVIPRNTRIPTKKQQEYFTLADNQSTMAFTVYEGENNTASKNTKLGKFGLHGLPLAPKGKVKANCWFEIDADGILHVTAEEETTSQRRSITIKEYRGSLSVDEIQDMAETVNRLQLENRKLKKFLNGSTSFSSS